VTHVRRILVTGSRNWTAGAVIVAAFCPFHRDNPDAVLVSGACPTGADAIAEDVWRQWGGDVERHPADWDRYGKSAGPRRNQEMVDLGADVCLAFPLPDSRGTKHCMAAAEKAGIPVQVFAPDAWDEADYRRDGDQALAALAALDPQSTERGVRVSTDWTDHAAIRCDYPGCVATGRTNISNLIGCGWHLDFTGDGRGNHHRDYCPTHADSITRHDRQETGE
jgi:hypothetical protein